MPYVNVRIIKSGVTKEQKENWRIGVTIDNLQVIFNLSHHIIYYFSLQAFYLKLCAIL